MKRAAAAAHPRVIVFGSGQGGRAAFRRLSKLCRVVAVFDNNPEVQGRRFCGVRIHAPEEVSRLKFDWICLASIYRDEMAGQLLGLGVPLYRLRDGSTAVWDPSGLPRPLSEWACRRTVIVGPLETCRQAAKSLAGSLDIVATQASDAAAAPLRRREADLYVIASPEPQRELERLMSEGIPLDAIEVLAPESAAGPSGGRRSRQTSHVARKSPRY